MKKLTNKKVSKKKVAVGIGTVGSVIGAGLLIRKFRKRNK